MQQKYRYFISGIETATCTCLQKIVTDVRVTVTSSYIFLYKFSKIYYIHISSGHLVHVVVLGLKELN